MRDGINDARQRLAELLAMLRHHRPDQMLSMRRQHFGAMRTQFDRRFQQSLKEQKSRFFRVSEMLRLLAPDATLARGYSITMKSDGSVIGSVAEVEPGMRLVTRLTDGEVESKAEG